MLLSRQKAHILCLLFATCLSSVITQNETAKPCDDFYDFVCQQPRLISKKKILPAVNYTDIEQRQEYVFPNETKNLTLFEVILPEVISKWVVEYSTMLNGVKWEDHWQRHEQFLKLSKEEQKVEIMKVLDGLSTDNKNAQSIFHQYYNSLKNVVNILRELKLPISVKNPFYHGILRDVMSTLKKNILEASTFSLANREAIIEKFNSTKVLFPFFDYNDIEKWSEAAVMYEKTYFRLKTKISEKELENRHAENIIRIGALSPSIQVLVSYMKEFTERFLFQSVSAMPTRDSFNYFQEVHVAVMTRVDPMDFDAVMTDTVFVMTHEIMHSLYNLEPHPFEASHWKSEKDCVLKRLQQNGQSDNVKVSDNWNYEEYIYEDISSIEAIRIMMQLAAQRSSNNQQLRDTLETFISPYCKIKKNAHIHHHSPIGNSYNTAISLLPNFNLLYNCVPGDRMYTAPEDICESMAIPQTPEAYEVQKIGKSDLDVLSVSLSNLEEVAADIVNSTSSFELEMIDGKSSESSSSSEEEEEREEEEEVENDDDKEIEIYDGDISDMSPELQEIFNITTEAPFPEELVNFSIPKTGTHIFLAIFCTFLYFL